MCFLCSQRRSSDHVAPYDTHQDTSEVIRVSAGSASPQALGDTFWIGIAAGRETTDAAESTATSYTMLVGQSFYGTLSSGTDGDWVAIQLVAGHSYDIRLLGQGSNFLLDPRVFIYDQNGVQLAEDDDDFTSGSNTHERDSRQIFTASYTGTYYVEADAFSTETGGYLLSVTDYNSQGMVFTADEIAWQLTNNGEAFFGSAEAAHFNIAPGGTLTVNITQLTAQGQYLARQALLAWTNVTGILFQEVSGAAAITFDDSDSGANAYANTNITPGTTVITSSTVMITTGWLTEFGTTLDSYAFETYIHEIGHALGLGHGGNYNGSATYGTDNFYLNDSLAWSIMSYMQAENDEFAGGGDWNTFTDASFRYLVTPQIADIIAIQNLYGTFSGAFTGDTTWGFHSNTGVAALDTAVLSGSLMAMTVFDNGGNDTLDFSGTTEDQIIVLAAESMSSVLGGRNNLAIARGVTIENAFGGNGRDTLLGTDINNELRGNAGNDSLYGAGGNDVLIGGLGADILDGGDGTHDRASYQFAAAGLRADLQVSGTNTGEAAGDTYANIEDLLGSSYGDSLLGNTLNNTIWGGDGNDAYLDGRVGNDTLYGGNGNDVMIGGWGADSLVGGAGTHDRVQYSDSAAGLRVDLQVSTTNTGIAAGDTFSGVEDLYGSAYNDSLLGDTGANTIWGAGGNDAYLDGRLGNDTIYGGAGNDVMIGGQGGDFLNGGAGTHDRVQYTDATSGVRVDLQNPGTNTGFAAGDVFVDVEDIYGSFYGDALFGNSVANTIWGANGNDLIDGRLGNDTLYGGAGSDTFQFSTALGATNRDTIGDYVVAADTIQLVHTVFTALSTGALAASAFTIGASATTASQRIIYNSATGALLYDADGSGAGAAVQFATLATGLAMTAGEFVVI